MPDAKKHLARFYHAEKLALNQIMSLSAATSHHLATVLRAKVNTEIILFDGEGGEYLAKILAIYKKAVEVEILAFYEIERESALKLHLGQAMARPDKMDLIIQKAVELGVTTFTPLFTAHSQFHLDAQQLAKRQIHWQAIIVSASEQCGRTRLMRLQPAQKFVHWVSSQAEEEKKILLSPHASAGLSFSSTTEKSFVIAVGPEGGFSREEAVLANQHQFLSVTLGPRILRTETAGLALSAILQFHAGDLRALPELY